MSGVAGMARAYAGWRASTLGRITDRLEDVLLRDLLGDVAGRAVLDFGCGDGKLAMRLAAAGAQVVGVDADPAMLRAAASRAAAAGVSVQFATGRAEALPFMAGRFDLVVAVTVLCFVPDAEAAFREIARVLRPGGAVVIGELGRWSLWAFRRRVRGWLGNRLWRAARFSDATELRRLAARSGLEVQAVRGAVFYPPVTMLARAMAPLDPWLGRITGIGAAFLVLRAEKFSAAAHIEP
ncbi:class I SAM-dependent methyltransferase [Acidiphilium sp.]|jgi:2-polyprenyl-3-methyl-5-hydroxy-6-metoxy-1,4-benzoquinol methylase|uniref:class I SAM-dependent methyltransferase n=1 Tax=Acidiphilium sp. TaxID=527 RepID=UPI0023168625|nr:class I SAM-dependent methyltransferase [Acidiphilium sp.]MDA8252677.1 class I SAM-dependent methyltransferase [Rhodospirillales bacterium]